MPYACTFRRVALYEGCHIVRDETAEFPRGKTSQVFFKEKKRKKRES